MKHIYISIHFAALLSYSVFSQASPIISVDRIIAIVNNEIILKSELERELSTIIKRIDSGTSTNASIHILAPQILEKMIIEELQLQAAEKAGIIINESSTDQTMLRIAKRNNLSLSEFKQALAKQSIDYISFRDNLKKEIAIEKLKIKMVENRITISDDEAQQLADKLASESADSLRQYKLGHILIPLPEGASPAQIQLAKKKAIDITTQLADGVSFKQTAMEQSAGSNALEGGILDWRTTAELPTLFASQLPKLQERPFIGPLRSASGFHLLSLLDTREQKPTHIVTLTRASHILLKKSELNSDEKLKAKLEIIRERALSGEAFDKLARTNSEDGSAKDGGDLGWQNPENLVPEFVKEMDKLEPGEISPVFKSRFGWHIIKIMERKQEDNTEEFLMSQARKMIRKRKISEATATWLRRLRDNAYIEYRLDDI